jgi:CzcA family heavy metal efflux pump
MKMGRSGILSGIVGFSLRFRGIIIALAIVLLGYSLYGLSRARYDVFPEFASPQVTILSEAPGLSPEQVEILVTQPIENNINGVSGIVSLHSSSIQGISIIRVIFQTGSDIYHVRQMIAERLASLGSQMPRGVRAPIMTPLTSSTGVVLVLGLTSERHSLMDLRAVADWTVRPQLLSVPGVASVAIFSRDVKQLQVQVQPDRLIKYHLSTEDVLTAAGKATAVIGAGFIDNENQRIILHTRAQSPTADELAKTVMVQRKGANLTLGEVARVVEAPRPPVGAAAIMGHPGAVLIVSAQFGANTIEVNHKLEQALSALGPALHEQGIILHPALFKPASFIQTALRNVRSSLLIGAVMVVVVLLLFLFNLRAAAISSTAIPLSLLTAVTILQYLGYSLNTMTLGGLAIAVGEVVDDAVVDVENIFRRLRENRRSDHPRPASGVVFNASIEVRSAVVYGTFAVALVFIPLLTLSGVAGRIFAPLGMAYILSILASLLVALTVTPALCLLFLGRRGPSEKEPPVARWLKGGYQNLLLRIEKHPKAVIGMAILSVAAVLATLPLLRAGFLPEFKEGNFIIHVWEIPGTSLEESLRMGRRITLELLKIPYVRSVYQRVGRAENVGEDIWGTHYSEFGVSLKSPGKAQAESAQDEIRQVLSRFPGINTTINSFLTERIDETISGYTAPVVVNIFGNDLDVLDKKGEEVAAVLRKIPGAVDAQVLSPPGAPQLVIKLRKKDLTRWGFDPVEILEPLSTVYQGRIVGQVYQGNQVFDVSVILDPNRRRSIIEVGRLPLRNSEGTYVRLGQLADIYETSGRFMVLHEGARRVQTVTCNVTGPDINSFVREAKKRILSKIFFPAGVYVDFSGAAQAQAQSRKDLIIHSLLAGVGIILLLSMVLGSFRNLLNILLNIPFALIGGILVVLASGGLLSLGSMVGFVTLFGITLRNSIMMISHYQHLVSEEKMAWGSEASIRGASERLVPILMTAVVTGLGLLPLAVGSGTAGREIEGPMAMVILGGLVTSTVLNLLVLPTLALRFGQFGKKRNTDSIPETV